MFISGIKIKSNRKKIRKTIAVYLLLALVAMAVNLIYGFFGHGVHSAAMTWMFLYPLLGGALGYFLIDRGSPLITRFVVYRIGYNSYNSGIGALTVGSFLKGILEIAGTNSNYLVFFTSLGWLFIVIGLAIFAFLAVKNPRKAQPEKSPVTTTSAVIHE